MLELNRRKLMTGAVAASAATALSPFTAAPAFAAAPLAGKQNPGWYRYKVGGIEVTVVTDGSGTNPLSPIYVANAQKDAVNAALEADHLAKDVATHAYSPLVVNTGAKLVAIDTGLGLGVYQQSKGALGQYHTNLVAAGIDKNTVDIVLISHLHGDHINGLLDADNKLAFANAEVMVPEAEVKYWMDDSNAARMPEPVRPQFANVKRVLGALGNKVTQYAGGKEIVPGLTSIAAPGHTPGHTAFMLVSGSERALFQVDITAGTPSIFARNPGWRFLFDVDGPLAEQTRRKLYDMAIAEKLLVQGYHIPFPSIVHVEKNGNGYRLIPALWRPTI